LVADYFPGAQRAMAMGILASGVSLGGVAGLLLGGFLEETYGWRVAFMTVGVPGFVCALLVGRLVDPTRPPAKLTIRSFLLDFHIGVTALLRPFWPLIVSVAVGTGLAYWLDRSYGADSKLDVAAFSAVVGLGLAINILYWVLRTPADPAEELPFTAGITGTFDEIIRAGKTVLHTPTLVYVFLAGAMISFGTNGIVGWGPTFVARELRLTAGEAAALLGKWGLIAGVSGTLFGGFLADWLRRRWETGRVITVGLGLLLGGPLAIWLLTIRDPELFKLVFTVAFFCLSWYNGPITAVIFDVVPPRISATVAGAYLLFIHLAGDAIALPLVGMLSDQFGLDRAILLLPLVSMIGGIVILGATRTARRDMGRVLAG
jgi:MFS family permease